MKKSSLRLWCALSMGWLAGGSAFGQAVWTNQVAGSATDVWGVAANWFSTNDGSSGIPGFDMNTGLGNSNDVAWLFIGTNNSVPNINLLASNYVLRSLLITEGAGNGDGNFISTLGGSSLTMESLEYVEGNRQLDFYREIEIADKTDGKAFEIDAISTLDIGGIFRGTEGLFNRNNGTIYLRNYVMTYGTDPTNGLTFDNIGAGARRIAFGAEMTSVSNIVHNIPHLTFLTASNTTPPS